MPDYWAEVVGQSRALAQLQAAAERPVHAYLFVGPEGVGKYKAALAFAAAILNDPRPLDNTHPDVITVEREGASINVAQAREISRIAARSPLIATRKVLILTEFHLVSEAAPALLKTIEEASETTVFIILAESVTHELVTVASRCVRIDFCSLSEDFIFDVLMSEGATETRARAAASGAMGSLDRARLLVSDDDIAARRELWINAISRLDGRGSSAAKVADEIMGAIDAASKPLIARQLLEVEALSAQIKDGTQTSGALKALETRHKREQRRLRTDELRAGLATLAQEMPQRLQSATSATAASAVSTAIDAVQSAHASLEFNPNESLLLQALFVRLSVLADLVLV
jgi:DNA polymerase III subunit delta'